MKKYISMLFVFLMLLTLLSGCGMYELLSSQSNTSNSTTKEKTTPKPTEEESTSVVIADDDFITATFERIYDGSDIGFEEWFYITIYVTNKTDKEIWVYLDKSSVNDEMVPFVMSGVPFYIKPEKSGRNSFVISSASLSVDKLEEVENIEFDLVVDDHETYAELDRVSSINLNFQI